MNNATRRCRGDAGQVAGIEVLPFGLLVLLVGVLLIANAWAVVDARMAVALASREGARAAAETVTGPGDSQGAATAAVHETLAGVNRDDGSLRSVTVSYPDGYRRCGQVRVEVVYEVPAISLPFIGGYGDGIDVTVTASELIDGYRSGDLEATPC